MAKLYSNGRYLYHYKTRNTPADELVLRLLGELSGFRVPMEELAARREFLVAVRAYILSMCLDADFVATPFTEFIGPVTARTLTERSIENPVNGKSSCRRRLDNL